MSPVSTGSSAALTVDYRYIFTDALTDTVLAELPLVNVSFTNKLNEAGTFEGDFPITENVSVVDVYNNTVPGKTSLYVLRNGVCVWGGLVSQRSYNIKEKILNISADDFISYLDRRVVWKTWSTEYAADVEIFEDPEDEDRVIGKVSLTGLDTHEDFELVPGKTKVWLSFQDDPENAKRNFAQYSGLYTVLDDTTFGVDEVDFVFFHFSGFYKSATSKNFKRMALGNIDSELVSVRFKMETDDYLDTLLSNHFANDLLDLGFANEYVAPSLFTRYDIASYSRANNVATVTTVDENNFVPGQIIAVKDLPGFSTSRTRVTATNVDKKTFSFNFTGSNLSTTVPTPTAYTITHFQRTRVADTKESIVTITTSTNHGFAVGDVVRITNLDNRIDANIDYVVTRIGTSSGPDPKVFQFENRGPEVRFSKAGANARATKIPVIEALTSGSFIENSDINIDFVKPDLVTSLAYHDAIRGAELFTFKEVIDKYSTDLIGFDYKITCSFDSVTNTFSKKFTFLPIVPDSLREVVEDPGGLLSDTELPKIEYFSIEGRNARGIAFEFPGNIESVDFTETLEEGATRVFAQGKTDVDAPPPYAGAADSDFLRGEGSDGRRWPLYDKVVKKDKMFYGNDLYEVANKTMSQAQLPVATFSLTVNGTLSPAVGDYQPGDWCIVRIDDPFIQQRLASYYENKGDTSRNVLLRKITSISVQLSTNPALPESVTLELVTEPGVDITGAERLWR